LHGPVRASDAAGSGTAQVIISFVAWKDGLVASTTHTVLVRAAKPGPKPEPVSSRLVKTLVHPDRSATVTDVRFFVDGTRLLAGGYPSGVVQVFDPVTGKELRRIQSPSGYRGTTNYALVTPDLRTLYIPVDQRKTISVEKNGTKQRRFERQGEVLAWELASGKELPPLKPFVSGRGVLAGYLSPTGNELVTVERSSYVTGEDVPNETVLWDLKMRTATSLGTGYGMAAFSPDGRRLALALFSSPKDASRLVVTDLASGRKLLAATATYTGRGFSWPVFSPEGKTLAVQDSAGRIDQPATIRLYDVQAGRELAAFASAGKYPFMETKFSPDGRWLAAADYHGSVTVWDVNARQLAWAQSLTGMEMGQRVEFSPDGRRLAVLAQAKLDRTELGSDRDPADLPPPRLFLFDAAKGEEPEVAVCPNGYCGGLAFSPDGKILAVGGSGGVHLFDLRTPR